MKVTGNPVTKENRIDGGVESKAGMRVMSEIMITFADAQAFRNPIVGARVAEVPGFRSFAVGLCVLYLFATACGAQSQLRFVKAGAALPASPSSAALPAGSAGRGA